MPKIFRDLEYYVPVESSRKNKKYMVKVWDPKAKKSKVIHFGSLTPFDVEQQQHYLRISAGIKDKQGNLTKDDPQSPNFWSRRYIWYSEEGYYVHEPEEPYILRNPNIKFL